MNKSELSEARDKVNLTMHGQLQEADKSEAENIASVRVAYDNLRARIRTEAHVELVRLFDVALALLDDSPAAAKVASTPEAREVAADPKPATAPAPAEKPTPAAQPDGKPAVKTAGPRPITRPAPPTAPATPSQLPDADAVFG